MVVKEEGEDMVELLRSNDPVLISYIQSLLDDSGIDYLMLDVHTSIMEGSLGILPRRMMVADEDKPQARRLLREAGLGHHGEGD